MSKIKLLGLSLALGVSAGWAGAQATPTATQRLQLSVFGGGTKIYTELAGDRNTAITAGFDAKLRTYFHFRPGLEIRGTYPIRTGNYIGLKDFMAGPTINKDFGRFHPYLDGMFGRGSIDYENGGLVVNNFRYNRTTTNIFAGGGGVDFNVTRQFDIKADVQFQRWATPVTNSGYFYPIPVTIGVVYRLDFNRHPRYKRPKDQPTQ